MTAQPAVREAFYAWGVAFALLLAAFLSYRPAAPLVATASFLYLPLYLGQRRGEDLRDYGLTLRSWRTDLRLFLICAAVIVPLFFAASWAFFAVLPMLPPELALKLYPMQRPMHFGFHLPQRFWAYSVEQLLVVALPEELFYRGFVQTRLNDAWPPRWRVLGARLGPSLFVTALLFAFGHLAIFEVWRLSVFFPALLFGYLRERTGSVAGSTLLHAFSNIYQRMLEAMFFGF